MNALYTRILMAAGIIVGLLMSACTSYFKTTSVGSTTTNEATPELVGMYNYYVTFAWEVFWVAIAVVAVTVIIAVTVYEIKKHKDDNYWRHQFERERQSRGGY